ncbi:MAG TPA: hypothetical protein VL527_18685 [Dongiaceae bacterium]|nr:hypothetical protein [Dongiaceae bacterium]
MKTIPQFRKRLALMAALGVATLLGACIPSVNQFYADKDVVFDSNLVGKWQVTDKADQPETWNFAAGDAKAYQLTVTDKDGKTGEFNAHLFQLKAERFLDLTPTQCNYATNQSDLVTMAMIPGHLLLRVSLSGKELKLAACSYDWLEKYLKAHPEALGHRLVDNGLVLTAGTPELQKFVLAHLGPDELFGEPGVLVRQTGGQ